VRELATAAETGMRRDFAELVHSGRSLGGIALFQKLKRVAREPLIHFLLIGGAIYALYGAFAADRDGDNERTITVTSGEIQSLTDQWMRLWSRPPTNEELSGIIRNHVRTQILYREAVAMGLDDGDTVIQRRLAQKVELLAQGLITPEEPSEEVLIDWYTANADRYKQPDRYSITQVFFDPDKRGATTLDDAKAALETLNMLDELPASYGDYGDRLMLQNYYANQSELDLSKTFGSGFAEQVIELEPGIWHGPVLSGYGTHLVIVNEVMLRPQPAFDDVKQQIEEEWMAEQIGELSERFVDSLVSRYEVVVEETEVPITIPGSAAGQ